MSDVGARARSAGRFDRGIRVEPAEHSGDAAGHRVDGSAAPGAGLRYFDIDLGADWSVGAGLNGGYLLAVLGNALRETLPGKPHPVSVSAYFLAAAGPGPARVSTRVVREGRGTATLAAQLEQQDVAVVTALATTGDLGGADGDVRTTALPPALPPLEDCGHGASFPPQMRVTAPLQEQLDLRLDPATSGWAYGSPSGRGVVQGWFAFPDGREPDPLSLLLTVDALPPVTFDLGLPGWAPTVELTVHVRAVPAPGWLRVRHATSNLAGGFFEEDCEVWDSTDRLVAQSRQLAKVPRETA